MQGSSSSKLLDRDSSPSSLKRGAWYVLSPTGYLPEPRVGHTATYLNNEQMVYFVGGANPDTLHKDTWSLDLSNLICNRLATKGDFEFRYEHSVFVPTNNTPVEASGTNIWVFGGANKEGNKNDLWELNVKSLKWKNLVQQGDVPSNRTIHSSTSTMDNELLVFGGGSLGSEAEPDTRVYRLNPQNKMWSVMQTTGMAPKPRHGHVLIAVKNKIYVHGGLSGETFYDDLHILNNNGSWVCADVSENKPIGRASHGAVYHGSYIYMFGGLSTEGVLGDFWRINIDTYVWEEILVGSSVPTPRLDFAMAIVELPGKFRVDTAKQSSKLYEESEVNSIEEYLNGNLNQTVCKTMAKGDGKNSSLYPFIIMHGGMDGSGQVYDDFHVYSMDPKDL